MACPTVTPSGLQKRNFGSSLSATLSRALTLPAQTPPPELTKLANRRAALGEREESPASGQDLIGGFNRALGPRAWGYG